MRLVIGTALALMLAISTASADYGEDLCAKLLQGAPCPCVGPVLQAEFSEEELTPLLTFMKAFVDGLKGDEAAAQAVINGLAAQHGESTIEGWMKRYSGLEPQIEKTCNWKS